MIAFSAPYVSVSLRSRACWRGKLRGFPPKYLSRVIRSATNGMLPKEWIERFVVAQAKRLIETNPNLSFKKIAMDLGFTEHSSFYRYFKRATGIYPQAYRNGMNE